MLAIEKLASSYRVANQVREGRVHQIRSILGSGSEDFASLDMLLANLHRKGHITRDNALHYCQDQKACKDMQRH